MKICLGNFTLLKNFFEVILIITWLYISFIRTCQQITLHGKFAGFDKLDQLSWKWNCSDRGLRFGFCYNDHGLFSVMFFLNPLHGFVYIDTSFCQ